MNFQINHKGHQKYATLWTYSSIFVGNIAFCILPKIISLADFHNMSIASLTTYCWISIHFSIANLQFSFAALALNERFTALNKGLKGNFSIEVERLKSLREFNLELMMQMHDRLCDGIHLLNSTFTVQV